MASVSYLVDTDILIDWLRGLPWAKRLVWSGESRLYCSSVTRKELLGKPGLSDNERKRIVRLLRHIRVLEVDAVIAAAASELLQTYPQSPLHLSDALIAATAWTKHLPLLTRNDRHYVFIKEIELVSIEGITSES